MENIIYYFSGTGNSLAISKYIADELGETNVVSILSLQTTKTIEESYQRIGFVIPVYYTHAPTVVINILKNIKLCENQKVFIIATYAGSRGYALADLRSELNKYHKIVPQEFCIRMPGSYIVEYGAFPNFIQRMLLKSAKKNVAKIAEAILLNTPTSAVKPNLIARLLNKKVVQKKIVDFNNMGVGFHTNDKCTRCGMCERICPVQNISVSHASVIWNNRCQQCMACIQWCPNFAIEYLNKTQHRQHYHNPDITMDELIKNRKE